MVDLIWKMGGQAGEGAMVTGRTLGKTFTRGGLNVIGYPEYPSLIRGGHNTYQIRVSDAAINSPLQKIDVVVALNKEGIYFHHANLKDGGALVYDEAIDISKYPIRADGISYGSPSASAYGHAYRPASWRCCCDRASAG